MLVGGVVHDEVEDELDIALLAVGDELVHVGEGAVLGIDIFVVGDVVAEVNLRRGKHGGDPDSINAEPVEIVEVLIDAVEVADAVIVGVGEGTRVELVEDSVLPPLMAFGVGSGGRLLCEKGGREETKQEEDDKFACHVHVRASGGESLRRELYACGGRCGAALRRTGLEARTHIQQSSGELSSLFESHDNGLFNVAFTWRESDLDVVAGGSGSC